MSVIGLCLRIIDYGLLFTWISLAALSWTYCIICIRSWCSGIAESRGHLPNCLRRWPKSGSVSGVINFFNPVGMFPGNSLLRASSRGISLVPRGILRYYPVSVHLIPQWDWGMIVLGIVQRRDNHPKCVRNWYACVTIAMVTVVVEGQCRSDDRVVLVPWTFSGVNHGGGQIPMWVTIPGKLGKLDDELPFGSGRVNELRTYGWGIQKVGTRGYFPAPHLTI